MKLCSLLQNNVLNEFRLEIGFVIIFKLALIFALKYAFFNGPVSKTLTPGSISQVILGMNPDVHQASPPGKNQ